MRPLDPASRLRIVVHGYVVRGPLGGFAWHHLQYVTGLLKLGHDVIFVEDSGETASCYDPRAHGMTTDPSYGLRFMTDACEGWGIGDRWAYYDAHSQKWLGPQAGHALDACAKSELLLNLNDPEPLRPWLGEIPVRALVDTDPVFMQIRNLQSPARSAATAQHTAFFTFGESLPAGRSTIPDDGFAWQPTRQPVDLELWEATSGRPEACWTTVMQWDSYAPVVHAGTRYGMKSATFEEYFNLPAQTKQPLEIAMGSASAPRRQLEGAGWRLADPLEVSRTPWSYQQYIAQSKGEFSIAKHGYVAARSGWFSERSASYLASGRPVVVQDTGFSETLPCGEGLLTFRSPEEAIARLEEANENYARHCAAARGVVRDCFDARQVLSALVDRAMSAPAARCSPHTQE